MMELSLDCLTEKGNLKTEVRKTLREMAINHFKEDGYEVMPNGKLAKVLATIGEKKITINMEIAIGLDTSFETKAKAKPAEEVNIPNLF